MKKILSLLLVLGFATFAFGDLRNQQNMIGGMKVGFNGIKISQIRCGVSGAMTAGSLTVADTNVTANSLILVTGLAQGGTAGALRVQSRVAGTSFTVTSSSGTDTSTFNYCIIEP